MSARSAAKLSAWRKRVDAYAESTMRAALAAQGVSGDRFRTFAAAEEARKDMDRLFRDRSRLLERSRVPAERP